MPMVSEMAGSSTEMRGSGTGWSGSARVSPIVTSAMPATATRSPATASSVGTRSSATVRSSSVILTRADRAVGLAPAHLLAAADDARAHPAERDAAEVAGGVEVGDVGLQRGVRVVGRGGHGGLDDVEERVEAGLVGHVAVGGAVAGGAARAAGGVDDREVEQAAW